ncbi:hypothetical protein TspCOW1_08830 [Thiohalobacter sp. COW1]|uniref:hypothetical protein n=1 Tax=Thiohalobacter sp. COW1 TaxID=2795687 RepID=UPI001915C7FF|nr:hypothetical protein [Thiohalobacter sp. COW1]BCO30780.1 hypothetical protein TspCOW1_08830 [Thiohalobacter sp. COW1]
MSVVDGNMWRAMVMFALLWPLLSCAASGGPVEGVVVVAETGKPIEGAIVVARWTAQLNQIADSSTMCYHVETTTTDSEGRYLIERWRSSHPPMLQQLFMFDREVHVTVYAKGYRMPNRLKKDRVTMVPHGVGGIKRLSYLKKLSNATHCGEAVDSKMNLLLFKQSLYDEARELASSREGNDIVETLLFGVESLSVGSDKALENMQIRRKNE